MALLENHLEQISLSSTAIAELSYGLDFKARNHYELILESQVSSPENVYQRVTAFS